ncbi:hypothetical protein SAMN05421827_109138 [Pedobacter terrae]|uniref:Uncharacterized protein n=1 Tax=Pedobacter terrae TaxID=405671 RepID=A0A1G7WAC9_9SPHI|nr:hypothetical protein [Pedobacter terrae]SDG68030.1 hypothetical protein SAMN05421827_109138 [Pedobacter terrae]
MGEVISKYKFRKMFFICRDKKVIAPNVGMTQAYQLRETAEQVCKDRTTHMIWEDQSKPIPKESVEGFYLVPEALYNEILKSHVDK